MKKIFLTGIKMFAPLIWYNVQHVQDNAIKVFMIYTCMSVSHTSKRLIISSVESLYGHDGDICSTKFTWPGPGAPHHSLICVTLYIVNFRTELIVLIIIYEMLSIFNPQIYCTVIKDRHTWLLWQSCFCQIGFTPDLT